MADINKFKKIKVIEKGGWHFSYLMSEEDIQKKIKIPLLSMPKEVFLYTQKISKKNSWKTYVGINDRTNKRI